MASSMLRLIYQKGTAAISLGGCGRGRGRGARLCTTRSFLNEPMFHPSTSPTSRISPWLMLPPAFEEGGNMVYKFYSLAEDKIVSLNKRGGGGEEKPEIMPDDDVYIVGSSHGWLALSNRRNQDLFLSNPLTRRHVKLPSVGTLDIPDEFTGPGQVCVGKLIISTSPDDDEEEDCRAMMIFFRERKLAFCVPGRSTEWTRIGALYHEDDVGIGRPYARAYEDFVYSKRHKRFFCVTKFGCLESWDLRDPDSPRIDWEDKLDDMDYDERNFPYAARSFEELKLKELGEEMKYLVFADEQSNEPFLVTRHIVQQIGPDGERVDAVRNFSFPYKTMGFDVHKIDMEKRELRYMDESLDGLSLFVGLNSGFALSAADFPELKPNSIYFTDKLTRPGAFELSYGGHDIGIFNYQDRTLSPCYYPCDVRSIKRIDPSPLWFTPSML